jgi:hypothetical protein
MQSLKFNNLKRKTMKLKNILLGIVTVAAIGTSCKKEDATYAPPTSETTDNSKNSGVVADNPADVAQVPLIISSDFLNNGIRTNEIAPNIDQARGTKPVRDAIAPTVSITSPTNGASVSGTVTVNVSATDNVGVSSVTFKVNGVQVRSWASAPYTFPWTPTTDGNYTLTATAFDAKGNSATHSIVVSKTTVIIVVPPPPTGGTLPSTFIMNTPPVFSQGGEGSCLSMALTAQRSIEQYYRTGATSYSGSTNILSPEFLYNQTKVSLTCGSGAAMLNSLNFIYNYGISTWNSLPYSSANGCDASLITSAMRTEALNYRIGGYNSILSTDVTAIKTSLAAKHPLSFTFQMDMNFYTATAGYIWNSRGDLMYTHALTLVGYDDTRRAYKAMNGWGSTWGDQGYIWIDYDFFKTITGYVYKMN